MQLLVYIPHDMCVCVCVQLVIWKVAKSGRANILKRKYFYGKKPKSYGAPLKSGGALAL